MTNEEMKTNIHCIKRDLEITMENDFDEIERLIEKVDLSNETKQWLIDILHKDMNRFFKDIMIRLRHPDYVENGEEYEIKELLDNE